MATKINCRVCFFGDHDFTVSAFRSS